MRVCRAGHGRFCKTLLHCGTHPASSHRGLRWVGQGGFGRQTRQAGEGRKAFFFEKKNQKTSTSLGSPYPERLSPGFKSFLLLFFKKEVLSFPAFPPADRPGSSEWARDWDSPRRL
jgi:hypothetical protein